MDGIGVIAALVSILNAVSGWNIWAFVLLVFVFPPLMVALALWKLAIAAIALRDEVRKENADSQGRYDDNVELVEDYGVLAKELTTMVRLNTTAMNKLSELIDKMLARGN